MSTRRATSAVSTPRVAPMRGQEVHGWQSQSKVQQRKDRLLFGYENLRLGRVVVVVVVVVVIEEEVEVVIIVKVIVEVVLMM